MIAFADYFDVRLHEPADSPSFSVSVYCKKCSTLLSHRVFDARYATQMDVQVACVSDALDCTHHKCRMLQ